MKLRTVTTVAVTAAALTGCSDTTTATAPDATASTTANTTTVPVPTEITAGWEEFCAAMEGFMFEEAPAGEELDRLAAVTDTIAAAAPDELVDAAALFDATFDAAAETARAGDGVLRADVIYEVAPEGSEPQAAIQAVFGAAEANCPPPDGVTPN